MLKHTHSLTHTRKFLLPLLPSNNSLSNFVCCLNRVMNATEHEGEFAQCNSHTHKVCHWPSLLTPLMQCPMYVLTSAAAAVAFLRKAQARTLLNLPPLKDIKFSKPRDIT